ncbi:putative nepenthesin [Lupinus albus]|uniref:Putative nepenthesin n=1 Tax=Lupinus albus TaxID=3870 RepID=A0A6A4R5S5_LUPAL|nr:putative nepenthesin [Lupinus albus]
MERMYSSLIFLLFCLSNISLIEGFGYSVELIHRDSPKSPFYIPSETHFERVAKSICCSINQANHFNKPSFSTKNIESDVLANRGDYLMSYSIGTPLVKILGIADTGSDIIWLQCKPCVPCSPQTSPIFDPSKSTTYKNIPCTSNACQTVRDTSCSSQSNQQSCEYRIGYGDGSKSQGGLSDQGQGSSIVGLGNGPVSLITQLGSSIQGKFAYCLAPSLSETDSPTKLNFGVEAVVSGDGIVSTPLFLDKVFYYLTLEAFSVGNKRLEFGSSSFSSGGSGNIIIDSGTTLTLLPSDVYSELESTVASEITLNRVEAPSPSLSLCYEAPSDGNLDVPVITAHFTGADVKVNALNTFFQVSEDTICFTFVPTNQPVSIYGNLAQQM